MEERFFVGTNAEWMISLGMFSSVNVWPVYHDFLFREVSPFRLVRQTPQELNNLLAQGKIQVSCISSLQYPFLKDRILLLPSFVLSSRGKVQSVLLFSKKKLELLSGCTIFVTNASLTSVALLRILLAQKVKSFDFNFCETNGPLASRLRANAKYAISKKLYDIQVCESPREKLKGGGQAALFIGDEALQAREAFKEKHMVYDLGEMWENLTGKPFVWAVWGIRMESLSWASQLISLLERSRQRGMDNLQFLARQASARVGLTLKFMEKYYHAFDYKMKQEHLEGLQLFYDCAHELGLAPSCFRLSFFQSNRSLAASYTP